MSDEQIELAPCPFCGGPVSQEWYDGPYVACLNDACDVAVTAIRTGGVAAEDWNTRPVEDALRAERDAALAEAAPEFEGNAIKEHLQQVHGIEGEPKGTRRMTMHVDGRTFFRSTQEWTLEGGVTLVQFTQHRRIAVLRPLAPPANPRNPRRRTRHNAIAR